MTHLPKAYIKKYGVSKEAWRAFRAHRLSNSKRRHTTSISSRGNYMARRHRIHHRTGRSSRNVLGFALGAAIYGALRPYATRAVSGFAGNLLGNYGTPLVLGTAGYFLSKSSGIIGDVGFAMMVVEAAQVGSNLTQGFATGMVSTSTALAVQ